MISITFLGTSSGVPTKTRSLPSIHLDILQKESILFDCGEGTQRQMFIKGLNIMKIKRIFITHWHADHFSGLIGLIQTLSLESRKEPLYIYGPKETRKFMDNLLNLGYFFRTFEVVVQELKPGDEIDLDFYSVKAIKTEHRIPSTGFLLKTKDTYKVDMKKTEKIGLKQSPLFKDLKQGKSVKYKGKTIKPEDILYKKPGLKIVYTGDTKPIPEIAKESKNANLLIMDSTFSKEYENKAEFTTHSTSAQAAEIAKKANVRQLIITHFSRRYENEKYPEGLLLKEAIKIFPNTLEAKDFMNITLK